MLAKPPALTLLLTFIFVSPFFKYLRYQYRPIVGIQSCCLATEHQLPSVALLVNDCAASLHVALDAQAFAGTLDGLIVIRREPTSFDIAVDLHRCFSFLQISALSIPRYLSCVAWSCRWALLVDDSATSFNVAFDLHQCFSFFRVSVLAIPYRLCRVL